MSTFVISKRFDDTYKFVFTSKKGTVIFSSASYELKFECEDAINQLKTKCEEITFSTSKNASGKFSFKLHLQEKQIALSRKFATFLMLEKGIKDVRMYIKNAEVLDFSTVNYIFD